MIEGLRRVVAGLAALAILAPIGCGSHSPDRGLLGAYRFADGRIVSVRMSGDDALRYRVYRTGASHRLFHDQDHRYVAGPGFSGKPPPIELTVEFNVDASGKATRMHWIQANGEAETAERINRETWVEFEAGDATLRGRLSLPDSSGPHPAVALVHGSGTSKATDDFYACDFLAANGIAALTYDKRGTGESQGEFTFDFERLAGDASAAVGWLAARDDIDTRRIGLIGYSQGAWVAPLAASLDERVRFVIASYGLVASPAEEARVETRNAMRERGVDEQYLDEIDELTNASVAIVASGFHEGWDALEAIKKRSKDAPWRDQLYGTTVEAFFKYPRWLIKIIGPRRSPKGLPWYYDSRDVLERLTIPMAWFLADADQSAPNELALPALDSLKAGGKPYEIVVFPDADHTMLRFEQLGDERRYTGYVPEYFQSEVEAARRLAGSGQPDVARP